MIAPPSRPQTPTTQWWLPTVVATASTIGSVRGSIKSPLRQQHQRTPSKGTRTYKRHTYTAHDAEGGSWTCIGARAAGSSLPLPLLGWMLGAWEHPNMTTIERGFQPSGTHTQRRGAFARVDKAFVKTGTSKFWVFFFLVTLFGLYLVARTSMPVGSRISI